MFKDKKKYKNGFTLVEVMLSMTLLFLVFLLSVPLFQSFLFRSEIDDAVNLYYRSLRTAQSYAQAGFQDTQWGVTFIGNQIIVFSGTSYAARNPIHDRTFDVSTRISVTGITEVVFSELYGYPSLAGTINISGSNVFKTINLNARGQINF